MDNPSTYKKRFLFTLLSAATVAAASILAKRTAAALWTRLTGAYPPKRVPIIGSLGRKAGESTAANMLNWIFGRA